VTEADRVYAMEANARRAHRLAKRRAGA
jgi:hypothetical protein